MHRLYGDRIYGESAGPACSAAGDTVRPTIGRKQGNLQEQQEGNMGNDDLPSDTARGSGDPAPGGNTEDREQEDADSCKVKYCRILGHRLRKSGHTTWRYICPSGRGAPTA